MASGIQHQNATIRTTALIGLVGIYASFDYTFFMMVGCFSGVVLSPDLDHHHIRTQSEKVVYDIPVIGWLIGRLWELYWIPYGAVCPHRCFISHAPVISTIVRLIYGIPIMWPMWWILWQIESPTMIVFTVGLMISDFVHWCMDYLVK